MLNVSSPGQLYSDQNSNNVSMENINKRNTSMLGSMDPSARPTLNFEGLNTSNENLSFEETVKKTAYEFKIILVGSIAVGKTAILTRYISNEFETQHKCTIKIEYKSKIININNMVQAKLIIWDTCGDEKYKAITRQYYKDANGVLLVYDITNRESFDNIKTWESEVKNNSPEDAVLFLVGNKTDNSKEREVTSQEGKKLAEDLGLFFIEVSAKNGDNIHILFEKISEEMIQLLQNNPELNKKESIKNLDEKYTENDYSEIKKKKKCC
jgi:small GTP-binding protein